MLVDTSVQTIATINQTRTSVKIHTAKKLVTQDTGQQAETMQMINNFVRLGGIIIATCKPYLHLD